MARPKQARAPISERLAKISAGLAGLLLIVFGASWLLDPHFCSGIFGVALAGEQLAYGRVKGAEDLIVGLLMTSFSLRRDRGGLRLVLAVGMLVPLVDAAAVIGAGIHDHAHLALHALLLGAMGWPIIFLRPSGPNQGYQPDDPFQR